QVMADEVKNPTPIDPENPPEPIKAIEGETVRELRDVPVEAVPTEKLDEVAAEVKEQEPAAAREARREGEDALNKPIEAIEDSVNALDREDQAKAVEHHAMPHIMGDTTVIRGRVIPLPLYTVVYGILAAITIVEVLITQIFPHGIGLTLALLGMSISKMVLVVLFYMHLREDSRMFAIALILPLFIAMVASIFLLAAPPTGY
ncbi:MAG: cytochrome C oxidase subunit IV family protein, partial [Chloroflexota bacterium]